MTKQETLCLFAQYVDMCVKRQAYPLAREFVALQRYSKRLQSIDVHRCNGTKYTDQEAYTRACQNVYVKLDEILLPQKLEYYHQSDPRGASLYVSRTKLDHMNYTNGIAIY